jgi:peroxiredoxin Q/BCP
MCTASAAIADSLVNSTAPGFALPDQYGEVHKLEDFRGKWLAVYFYPRDDTPGCTTEACNFRDNIFAFRKIGAEVVGISVDSTESHKEFSDKYKLPFKILSDEGGHVTRAYGALKDMKLVKYAKRESFLINPDGVIVKHYEKVDPETHTQQVLADLESLMQH